MATYLMLFRGVRPTIRRFHLWAGLVTGSFLVMLGLSGAALVLGPELDDALIGGRPSVSAAGPAASLDAVVAAARARYPGSELRFLRLPETPERPVRVEMRAGRDRLEVLVDPRTARVLRGRVYERSVLVAVHSLHARLHAGRAGALVVALLGVVLVAESLTGIWLCRPWGRGTRRRSGFELHRVLGAASLTLNVLVALTGVLLAVAGTRAFPEANGEPASRSGVAAHASLDAAVALAQKALPDARVGGVGVSDAEGVLRVEMFPASGLGLTGPVPVLVRNGEVVAVGDSGGAGAWAWRLVRRLHDGDFAGWFSRGLWVVLGLSVAVLAVTGYLSRAPSIS